MLVDGGRAVNQFLLLSKSRAASRHVFQRNEKGLALRSKDADDNEGP